MRAAVIDLGTNTCNLLIAEIIPNDYTILHQSKQFVKLGDNKILSGKISREALERTINAFRVHHRIIRENNVEKVKVIATSAVRQSENKIDLLEKIGEETGWAVKVITGKKEAELIFEGVLLALKKFEKETLILDIGGGSNEFILAKGDSIVWKESQPTGIARVINQFPVSDPITDTEIYRIRNFFAGKHKQTFQRCAENNAKTLVGCSGAFDTIADIIDKVNPGEKQRIAQSISIADFNRIYSLLIKSTRRQRLEMKGMDVMRTDLIVPAIIFIQQVIEETGISKIIQTDFSLREGVFSEMIKQKVS